MAVYLIINYSLKRVDTAYHRYLAMNVNAAVGNVLEDGSHAIYFCRKFLSIRYSYKNVLEKYHNIKLILNPEVQDINKITDLLLEIDVILNNR